MTFKQIDNKYKKLLKHFDSLDKLESMNGRDLIKMQPIIEGARRLLKDIKDFEIEKTKLENGEKINHMVSTPTPISIEIIPMKL
mgnify:CR=1 FL=1